MAKKTAAPQPNPGAAGPAATAAAAVAAGDDKAAAANAVMQPVTLDDILWMRDRFSQGLGNLEHGVRQLRNAFENHLNMKLPDGHPLKNTTAFNFQGGLFSDTLSDLGSIPLGGMPGQIPGQKRKRKPHDPNAPKRALTSYFLFMQSNKPVIKREHPEWTAQQISEESEKRWANISEDAKRRYEYMYNVDLARYYKQKEEYDAGRPIPEIHPDEAQRLYDEHLRTGQLIKGRKGRKVMESAAAAGQNVPGLGSAGVPAADEASEEEEEEKVETMEVDAEADEDDDEDDDDDSDEEEAPPPKSKKAKTGKAAPSKSPKKADSPEKKKARGKKAAADDSDNSLVETDDKKKDKKTRKRKSGKAE